MLTSTTTTMLRSGVGRSCGLQPILLRSTACPYSTLNATAFSVRPKFLAPSPAPTPLKPSQSKRSVLVQTGCRRHASRDATQDAAAAYVAANKEATAHPDEAAALDWNTFFALRKQRRRWQLTCSIISCGVGGSAGALFLGGGTADSLINQIPLDPFITLGLMTLGFAALGWLAGPSMGSGIFYAFKKKYKTQMTVKEGQFFARIKKNRVDPSASSASNPVPDFYGEKIQSVAGYRQWLKDQRAFNKKRTTFV